MSTCCEHLLWALVVSTCCEHLLWALVVSTCCEHLLWALVVSTCCEHLLWALVVSTCCGNCTSEWEGLFNTHPWHRGKCYTLLSTNETLRGHVPLANKAVYHIIIAALIAVSTAECERRWSMSRLPWIIASRHVYNAEDPPLTNFNFERAADTYMGWIDGLYRMSSWAK